VIAKHRKRKEDEEKVRLRKEAALRRRRQAAFGGQQGSAGEARGPDQYGRDPGHVEMAKKIKPTRVDRLPVLYKEWMQ
jgi:hypothetical protein